MAVEKTQTNEVKTQTNGKDSEVKFNPFDVNRDQFMTVYRLKIGKQSADFEKACIALGLEVPEVPEEVKQLNSKLQELESFDLSTMDEDMRELISLGISQKKAKVMEKLSTLQSDSPQFQAIADFVYELWTNGCLINGTMISKPKTGARGQKAGKRSVKSDGILAFSFAAEREVNGIALNIPVTTCYVVGSQHERVASLNLAEDKVHIFNDSGLLVHSTNATHALGKIMGEAVVSIHGGNEGTVSAISSCGVSAFNNGRAKKALEVLPSEFYVSLVSKGKSKEKSTENVGDKAITE